MNALKIQQDMLTEKLKGKNDRNAVWYEIDDKHVALCLNAAVIVCLPKADNLLDLSKFREVPDMKRIVWNGINTRKDENQLNTKGTVLLRANGKRAQVFNVNGREVHIDPNLLKYFDLKTAKLYQAKEHGAVLITETTATETVAGIVMPLKN